MISFYKIKKGKTEGFALFYFVKTKLKPNELDGEFHQDWYEL